MVTKTSDALPPMTLGEYGWHQSDEILGFYPNTGRWRVVTCERMDEESPHEWRSCCSERWSLPEPSHWMLMPPSPNTESR